MTLAEDLRSTLDTARAIAGTLGLRMYRVYLLEGYWSGPYTGDGEESIVETELLVGSGQPPKVTFATGEQIALGSVAKGGCTIGPLTPSHSGGGVPASLLEGSSLSAGDTLHVRLVHQDGSETIYRVTDVDKSKSLRIKLTCEPVGGAERVVD